MPGNAQHSENPALDIKGHDVNLAVIIGVRTLVCKVIPITVAAINVRAIADQMSLLLTVTALNRLCAGLCQMPALSAVVTLKTIAIIDRVTTLTTVVTDLGCARLVDVPTVSATAAANLGTIGDLVSLLLTVTAGQYRLGFFSMS